MSTTTEPSESELFDTHADYSEDGDLRHTSAEFCPSETTIWGDEKYDAKGNELSRSQRRRAYKCWKYHSGTDGQTHAGESRKGPFVRDDKEADNIAIAQAVCQQIDMTKFLQEQVITKIKAWNTNSFSKHHSGIYGMVLAAIAVVVADSPSEALESPWVQDPVYHEVAEKHDVDIEKVVTLGFKKAGAEGT